MSLTITNNDDGSIIASCGDTAVSVSAAISKGNKPVVVVQFVESPSKPKIVVVTGDSSDSGGSTTAEGGAVRPLKSTVTPPISVELYHPGPPGLKDDVIYVEAVTKLQNAMGQLYRKPLFGPIPSAPVDCQVALRGRVSFDASDF